MISDGENRYEFFPSKGLSVGRVDIKGKSLFWDQPSGLYDPGKLDLRSKSLHINGKPAEGFMYIATYCGGVELLGLINWGMPAHNAETERLEILHGETSSIPVEEVTVIVGRESISIEASFDFRTFRGLFFRPWYRRGKKIFRVTRKVLINRRRGLLEVADTFRNVSKEVRTPDWGYHVTFRPEPGARYIVPARKAESRGGGEPPDDHRIWQPSPDDSHRIEKGIIFKDLFCRDNDNQCTSLLVYPDGSAVSVKTPPVPYFQTWFCSGGAGSEEFTWNDGQPVLKKNWDGIGIEFGSSALDHDGNTDPSVIPEPPLNPGEVRTLSFSFELLSPDEAVNLEVLINHCANSAPG
jgi:hypothetical protein